jgi:hypothetical protein
MGVYTPVRHLYKPADGETGWGGLVDANWDDLDTVADKTYVDTHDTATLASAEAYTDAQIAALPPAGVTSVFTRSGAVVAEAMDYAAVDNLELGDNSSSSILFDSGLNTIEVQAGGGTGPVNVAASLVDLSTSVTEVDVPTPITADNSHKAASTAFVKAQGYLTAAPVTSVAGKTGAVVLVEADITNLTTDLAAKEATANKDAANGYAGLDAGGKLKTAEAPTWNQSTTGSAASLSAASALPNGTTGTTQAAGDNSTKLATTAYADAEVATFTGTSNAVFYGFTVYRPATPDTIATGPECAPNVVYCFPFILPFKFTVRSIVTKMAAALVGTYDAGLFDASGNNVVSLGGLSTNTVAPTTTPVSAATLPPGLYYLCLCASVANVNFFGISNGISGTLNFSTYYTAANPAISGVLPSTLGALTAQNNTSVYPLLAVFRNS